MLDRLTLMQQTIQLNFMQLLMIPVFLVAAFFGWKRGWREEAITTVGLIMSLVLFSNEAVSQNMAVLLNRIVGAFGVFINALFGGDQSAAEPFINAENFDTFRAVAFLIGAVVSYIIGSAIGRRSDVSRAGQLIGAGAGVFNSYIVLSKLMDFWLARERAGADLPFDQGANIIVSPIPQNNELRANLPTIFTLLFLIILIVTFFRLPKIRQ
ncbi:MAG: hypothetical protein H0T53_17710 [Herpetosiphonaceae bacterium]|nr:hypothetical protein [Herpetosiphonaceae bacterium]